MEQNDGKEVKNKTVHGLILGDHSYGKIKIIGDKYGSVIVGKFTSIADEVKAIMVGHYHSNVSTFPFNHPRYQSLTNPDIKKYARHPKKYGNITIGNDCWIGYGVTIIGGVNIADGSVIGAGAVVANDTLPYSINTRIPAIALGMRFTPRQIDLLLKIKWWDWPLEKIIENSHLLCSDMIEEFIQTHSVREEGE